MYVFWIYSSSVMLYFDINCYGNGKTYVIFIFCICIDTSVRYQADTWRQLSTEWLWFTSWHPGEKHAAVHGVSFIYFSEQTAFTEHFSSLPTTQSTKKKGIFAAIGLFLF